MNALALLHSWQGVAGDWWTVLMGIRGDWPWTWTIAIVLSFYILAYRYVRYRLVPRVLGMRITRIGFLQCAGLGNWPRDAETAALADEGPATTARTAVHKRLLFHIGTVKLSLWNDAEASVTSAPSMTASPVTTSEPPPPLLTERQHWRARLTISNVDVVLTSATAFPPTFTSDKKPMKPPPRLSAHRFMEYAGLAPSAWTTRNFYRYPAMVLLRHILVFALTRFLQVDVRNIRVRIVSPTNKQQHYEWHCEACTVRTTLSDGSSSADVDQMDSAAATVESNVDDENLVRPDSLSVLAKFQRMTLSRSAVGITTPQDAIDRGAVEMASIEQALQVRLRLDISPTTCFVSDPRLFVKMDGLQAEAALLRKLAAYENMATAAPTTTLPPNDPTAMLTATIRSFAALLFSSWAINIRLSNTRVRYELDGEQKRSLISMAVQKRKAGSRRSSFLFSTNDACVLECVLDELTLSVQSETSWSSRRASSLDMDPGLRRYSSAERLPREGTFVVSVRTRGVRADVRPLRNIDSVYHGADVSIVRVARVDARHSLPFGLVQQWAEVKVAGGAPGSGNTQFPTLPISLSVDEPAVVLDLLFLANLKLALRDGAVGKRLQQSSASAPSSPTGAELSPSPINLNLFARFGAILDITIRQPTFIITANHLDDAKPVAPEEHYPLAQKRFSEEEEPTSQSRFSAVAVGIKEFTFKLIWEVLHHPQSRRGSILSISENEEELAPRGLLTVQVSSAHATARLFTSGSEDPSLAALLADGHRDVRPIVEIAEWTFSTSVGVAPEALLCTFDRQLGLWTNSSKALIDGADIFIDIDASVQSRGWSIDVSPKSGLTTEALKALGSLRRRKSETSISQRYASFSTLGPFVFRVRAKAVVDDFRTRVGNLLGNGGESGILIHFDRFDGDVRGELFDALEFGEDSDFFSTADGAMQWKGLAASAVSGDEYAKSDTRLLAVDQVGMHCKTRADAQVPLNVECTPLFIDYGLSMHIAMWHSVAWLRSMVAGVRNSQPLATALEDTLSSPASRYRLLFDIRLPQITASLALPEDTNVSIYGAIHVKSDAAILNRLAITCPSLALRSDCGQDIFAMSTIVAAITVDRLSTPTIAANMSIETFTWFLPFGFDFAKLVDNITNFVRLVKHLAKNDFVDATVAPIDVPPRKLRQSYLAQPTVHLAVGKVELIFEDDDFDSVLARNFRLGVEECESRELREMAFMRKANALRQQRSSIIDRGIITDEDAFQVAFASEESISAALDRLQMAHGRKWLERVRACDDTFKPLHAGLKRPPLFHTVIVGLEATISAPTLGEGQSVEELIHVLDSDVPEDLLYDTLIALHLDVTMLFAKIHVRDHASSIFELPTNENARIRGNFILAEHVQDYAYSARRVSLAVPHYFGDADHAIDKFIIHRILAPTKFFLGLDITLPVHADVGTPLLTQVNYGLNVEPHLADLNRVFARLTPTSPDPSPTLPFWDKIVLMFHGWLRLRIGDGGALRVRVHGGRSADASGVGRNAGLDVTIKNGAELRVGRTTTYEDNSEFFLRTVEGRRALTLDSAAILLENYPIVLECGEVVVSVPINQYQVPGMTEYSDEEVVARLAGGVQAGFRVDFEKMFGEIGSHVDVAMRPGVHTELDGRSLLDSFSSIRSDSLAVNIFFAAPVPGVGGDPAQSLNYVNLTQPVLAHFYRFAELYNSQLALLPVRRGSYFYPPPMVAPANQKLSRYIKSLHLNTNVSRVLMGYSHLTDEFELGLRAKTSAVSLSLSMQQKNFIPGQRQAGWDMKSADFDMADLVVRVVKNGIIDDGTSTPSESRDLDDDEADSFGGDNSDALRLNDERKAERELRMRGWTMRCSDMVDDDEDDEDEMLLETMEDFFAAPKVIYYRNNGESTLDGINLETGESTFQERDVNFMQIQLLQKRLEELDQEIADDKLRIKLWEDRIAIFADDVLTKQSKALVEKMSMLYEKREILQDHIRRRLMRIKKSKRKYTTRESIVSIMLPQSPRTSHLTTVSAGSTPSRGHRRHMNNSTISSISELSQIRRAEHLHRFVVHNLQVMWNTPVRNSVFKLIDLEQQSSSKVFFVTQSAMRVLREVLADLKKKKDDVTSSVNTSSSSLDLDPGSSSSLGDLDGDGTVNLNTSQLIAQQLLEKLVAEGGGEVVVPVDDTKTSTFKPLDDKTRPSDPSDPTYVSPEYSIYNDFMVQLFYPQVSFETERGKMEQSTVLVSAESAQIKSSSIMDEEIGGGPSEGALVKNRRLVTINNAQFFVVFRKDVFEKLSQRGLAMSPSETPWPIYVPIECLLEPTAHTEEVTRVVKQTRVSIQVDACSPLYLRANRRKAEDLFSSKPDGTADAVADLEHVDSVFVDFPRIEVAATSNQYAAIFDVITHLVKYNDPQRKQRNDDLRTMIFAMRKQNLDMVIQQVAQTQEYIRRLNVISRSHFRFATRLRVSPLSPLLHDVGQVQLKYDLERMESDLLLTMEALKMVAFRRRNRNSIKKNFRTLIVSREFLWHFLLDNSRPLCDLSLLDFNYYSLSYVDRSRVNTIEVDKVLAWNRLPRPFYRELIGPYTPGGEGGSASSQHQPTADNTAFTLRQMLRVFWRQMAPVAGIPVIEHFEVNIHPLLFQLTYDVAVKLVEYLYPAKKRPAAAPATNAKTMAPSASAAQLRRYSDTIMPANPGVGPSGAPGNEMNSGTSMLGPFDRRMRSLRKSRDGLMFRSPSEVLGRSLKQSASEHSLTTSVATSSTSGSSSELSSSRGDNTIDGADKELHVAGKMKKRRRFQRYFSGLSETSVGAAADRHRGDEREGLRAGRSGTLASSTSAQLLTLDVEGDKELKLMNDRASNNKTFLYVKVPGAMHCVSYHGKHDKNIEDLYQFALKLPTLEYHNRTWTWLEFMLQVRRDIGLAIIAQTGSLVREKLLRTHRHRPPKELRDLGDDDYRDESGARNGGRSSDEEEE